MEKYVYKRFFSGIVLPTQKNDILEFNQYMRSDKMPYKILKTYNCKNNPEKSLTTKIGEHIPCKY